MVILEKSQEQSLNSWEHTQHIRVLFIFVNKEIHANSGKESKEARKQLNRGKPMDVVNKAASI